MQNIVQRLEIPIATILCRSVHSHDFGITSFWVLVWPLAQLPLLIAGVEVRQDGLLQEFSRYLDRFCCAALPRSCGPSSVDSRRLHFRPSSGSPKGDIVARTPPPWACFPQDCDESNPIPAVHSGCLVPAYVVHILGRSRKARLHRESGTTTSLRMRDMVIVAQ